MQINKHIKQVEKQDVQRKYCSCIMKVRPKFPSDKAAPYAICTTSVLNKYGVSRPPSCKRILDLEDYTLDQLIAYASELAHRKKNPMRQLSQKVLAGTETDNKHMIIKAIEKYYIKTEMK